MEIIIITVMICSKIVHVNMHEVCVWACRFQFLYSLIHNCHNIQISYKEMILTQKANYSSFELVFFKIQNLCNPRLSVIRNTFKTRI